MGAAIVNITAVAADSAGYVTAYGAGAKPASSTVNFAAGQVVPNQSVVPLAADGSITLANSPHGSVHVVVDVVGFYRSGEGFHTLTPARIHDQRPAPAGATVDGISAHDGALLDGDVRDVPVAGRAGVPAGASVVLLNVVTLAPHPGFATLVTKERSPGDKPRTSHVNHVQGRPTSNLVVASVRDGHISYTTRASDAEVIVDVIGYYE